MKIRSTGRKGRYLTFIQKQDNKGTEANLKKGLKYLK
jgi:hypothetical protein